MTFKLQSKMSSIILVNDLFEELREENERLKQTIDLMVKYRICLIDFKDNCNCDKNLSNKLLVDFLEDNWSQFKDNEDNQRSQHPIPNLQSTNWSQIVVQTDPIDNYHSNDGIHSTADEVIGYQRSNERIVVIDDSSSDEDLDVSPLVRNVIESNGEDILQEIGDKKWVPTADTSKTLRSTLVRTRRSTTRVIDSVGNRKHRLKCQQSGCDRSFVYHYQLNRHMKESHPKLKPNEPFSCILCPNTFKNSRQLGNHYNSCHSLPTVGQLSAIDTNRELNRCRLPDGRGYRCHYTDCRQVLKSIHTFTGHMRIHRADYRFGCNECHKKFVDCSRLKEHKKYSHNKSQTNVLKCQYTDCHYKTTKRSDLNSHQLRHENKRSFKCPINGCKYRANTDSGLRDHRVNRHGFKRRKQISH